MKNVKLLAALALATTAVTATVCLIRKRRNDKMRDHIANAGYEFAYDIHYPVKYKR